MSRSVLIRLIVLGLLLLVGLPVSSIVYTKSHALSANTVSAVKPVGQISDQQALYDSLPQNITDLVDSKINYFISNNTDKYNDQTYHVDGVVTVNNGDNDDLYNTYQFKMLSDNDNKTNFTVNVNVRSFNGTFLSEVYINGTLQNNSASGDNPQG